MEALFSAAIDDMPPTRLDLHCGIRRLCDKTSDRFVYHNISEYEIAHLALCLVVDAWVVGYGALEAG